MSQGPRPSQLEGERGIYGPRHLHLGFMNILWGSKFVFKDIPNKSHRPLIMLRLATARLGAVGTGGRSLSALAGPRDQVHLRGLIFHGHHGVYEEVRG